MAYRAKVIRVMIASPSDVLTERLLARDVVYEWNHVHSEDKDIVLIPVGWESHASPEMGERPQAIINKQVLKTCDLLIAIFWTRLGTPTGKFASGTIEEIEKHVRAGKPTMIYFSSAAAALDHVQEKQYKALVKFKEECRQRGLIAEYTETFEFKEKLARQLAQAVLRHFSKKNGQPDASDLAIPRERPLPKLSNRARILLREALQDDRGAIYRLRLGKGLSIQTHGMDLVESRDPRTEAKWEEALRQLCDAALVEEYGTGAEILKLTHEGFRVASFLRPEPLAVA